MEEKKNYLLFHFIVWWSLCREVDKYGVNQFWVLRVFGAFWAFGIN